MQGNKGDGPVIRVLPGERICGGHVFDIRAQPLKFEGERWHGVEPWMGGDLWIVKAWVPWVSSSGDEQFREELRALGFETDIMEGSAVGSSHSGLEGKCVLSGLRRGNSRRVPESFEQVPYGVRDEALSLTEEWELSFPHQVVVESWMEGAVALHESASHLCKTLLTQFPGEGSGGCEVEGCEK